MNPIEVLVSIKNIEKYLDTNEISLLQKEVESLDVMVEVMYEALGHKEVDSRGAIPEVYLMKDELAVTLYRMGVKLLEQVEQQNSLLDKSGVLRVLGGMKNAINNINYFYKFK